MGRHADPDTSSFWRSVFAAASRGLLALLLTAALTMVLASIRRPAEPGPVVFAPRSPAAESPVRQEPAAQPPAETSRDEAPPTPATDGPSAAQTAAAPGTAAPAAPPDTAAPAAAPPTAEGEPAGHTPAVQPDAPAPADTTVQVLDGVGDRVRTRHAVAVLRALGYRVVAVNPAAMDYARTTILYSPGMQAAAEALRRRDGRFVEIGPNRNLSERVHLHVVVGRDFPRS